MSNFKDEFVRELQKRAGENPTTAPATDADIKVLAAKAQQRYRQSNPTAAADPGIQNPFLSAISQQVNSNAPALKKSSPTSTETPKTVLPEDAAQRDQQGTDSAQKTLDTYIASPQRQAAMQREQGGGDSPQSGQAVSDTPPKDETLERLQAAARKEQAQKETSSSKSNDQSIYEKDMADLNAMTEDERKKLRSYGNYLRIQRQDASSEMGPEPGEEEPIPREYQALVGKYGADRLAQLAETSTRSYQLEQRENVQDAAKQNSNGVLASILTSVGNLVTSPVSGVVALAGRLDEAKNRTGRYSSLSPYTYGDAMNVYADTSKQNIQQQIEGDDPNILRKGASLLYQAGTGALESAAKAITLGPTVAAATSAMNQYTRTLSEASERGATSGQATLLASSSAALDYVMDKIPLDNLFGLAKEGSTSALKAALKQAGIEATTEGASFIGSQLLDMAILQDNSEYEQNIQNYMAQDPNMSYADAKHLANKDLIDQAGQQLLVAGISGGVSAGVSTAIGNARNRRAQALLDGENAPEAAPDTAPTETTPEQLTARQAPPPDQLLQNPQQLPQEQPIEQAQPRNIQPEPAQAETPLDTVSRTVEESVAKRKQSGATDDIVDVSSFKDPKEWKNFLDKRKKERKKARKRGESDGNYLIDNPLSREEKKEIYMKGYLNTAREARMLELFDTIQDGNYDAYTERANAAVSQDAFRRAQDAAVELRRLMSISDADYDAELSGNPHPVQSAEPAPQPIATAPLFPQQADAPDSSLAQAAEPDTPRQSAIEPPLVDIPTEDSAVQTEIPQPPAIPPIDTVSALVEESTTQRRTQQEAARQSIQNQTAALTGDPAAAAQPDTLGMQSEPSGDVEKSRSVTNSGLQNKDADIRAGYRETLRQDREAGDYQVKHNTDTLGTAQQRTSSPERVRAEYDYLMNKGDSWTAEDVATGRLVAKELFKSGDVEGTTAMNKQLAKVGTNAGQVAQAFAISGTMKDASDPMSASESATARFLAMDQGDTTYKKTKNGPTFEQWQNNVTQEYTRIAMAVDSVPEGDTKAMRDVIRQIAQSRKTTAWFGTSSRLTKNAQRILNKLDFDTLKKIANTQIAAMPDDFRARGKMEIAEGLRKQGMLSSLKTFERNLAGNSATGLLDSFSDSIGGRFVDSLMAKATGKRTVGNDLKLPGKYLSAAKDSMDFASLCVELNVPIETDANAAFDSATGANGSGKYIGKTFRSNGNVAMRVLYGYQKYMSYALEVSDKVFEGGTNAAVTDSLNRLKNSNLSDADISELAEFTANRRTFKDATWEENGKTHGSNLSRVAQQMKNIGKGTDAEPFTKAVGDVVMPFASVPMNVAQTGIDYTAGVGKGAIEIARIIHDARHGKEISVARQRQAASDFGRGMTGLAFIGIMTTAAANGIIQVHDDSDKNKKALDQSQGLSGAQINWSALGRASEGGSEKWQTGDVVTSLDFLEPFNTQMYLAVELAQDDAVKEFMANPSSNLAGVGKAYAKSAFPSAVSSFMDSPMMDGLTQLQDMLSNGYDAVKSGDTGDLKNALAEYGGNVASSFVPQFVRQTAQTMDGYYRDTRGKDSAEYAKNSILNAIPGASETLPKKVNGFGQEQKRGGFVSNFLDPTNTHRLQLDKTAQSLDELSQNPDVKNIYPERQAPLKVKDASGEDVQLTAEQRETYQKEYGKRVKEYYDGLLKNASFDNLSDEMKAEALQKAKEYGAQFARAAVTDYKDVPKDGGKTSIVFNTVRDVLKSNATSAVGDLEKAWELGNDTKKATDTLNAVYDTISKMPGITKKSVLEKSSGNTRIYLEARNSGFASDTTLSIIKAVQSIPEKNRGKRPVQLQSVASTKGLSDAQLDTAMKLYMPDYDPKDKEPDKTEVKYDYIRKELGLSAKEYADTYYAYLYSDTDGDGKSLKDDKVQGIIDLGFDKKMAEQLYHIYAGSGNKTKAAIAEFIEENY
jgi:hypothetical protein